MDLTGRCYCGDTTLTARNPKTVLFCHCSDCRRSAGAPVAAFVEFSTDDFALQTDHLKSISVNEGVTRSFCGNCGSPVYGTYDYLPGMIYVSLGLLDQADLLPPTSHTHHSSKYRWLHINEDLPTEEEYRLDE